MASVLFFWALREGLSFRPEELPEFFSRGRVAPCVGFRGNRVGHSGSRDRVGPPMTYARETTLRVQMEVDARPFFASGLVREERRGRRLVRLFVLREARIA